MDRTRLAFLVLLVGGCTRSEASRPAVAEPIVAIDGVTATTRLMPQALTLTGSLRAYLEAQVAADSGGRITATFVERGDLVARHAPLVRLDARSARLALAESRALSRAELARRRLADVECARSARLLAQGAITPAEYDRQRALCATSTSSSDAAATREQLARKSLHDALVRAPFAGVVAERLISIGEYARPGVAVVTLLHTDRLRLELTVAEPDVAHVQLGQQVSFSVAAFGNRRFVGRVRFIGPALHRSSRELVVEALVDNAGHELRPGMFAVAEVRLAPHRETVVPLSALQASSDDTRVFVISRGVLEERVVHVRARHDGLAAVHGVLPGERVALTGAGALRDGLRVRVR